jgi:hypothetical protein
MRRVNGFAQTEDRFRQTVAARIREIQPQARNAMKYGEYCQIIGVPHLEKIS